MAWTRLWVDSALRPSLLCDVTLTFLGSILLVTVISVSWCTVEFVCWEIIETFHLTTCIDLIVDLEEHGLVNMCPDMQTCTHTDTYTHACMHMHTHPPHTHIHTHTHSTHMYVDMHAYIHSETHSYSLMLWNTCKFCCTSIKLWWHECVQLAYMSCISIEMCVRVCACVCVHAPVSAHVHTCVYMCVCVGGMNLHACTMLAYPHISSFCTMPMYIHTQPFSYHLRMANQQG